MNHDEIANCIYDERLFNTGAGNLLNALLDPILIFIFRIGIGGAAIATVISEYVGNVVNFIMLGVLVSCILLSIFLS